MVPLKAEAKTAFETDMSRIAPELSAGFEKFVRSVYATTISSDHGLREIVLKIANASYTTANADAATDKYMMDSQLTVLMRDCPESVLNLLKIQRIQLISNGTTCSEFLEFSKCQVCTYSIKGGLCGRQDRWTICDGTLE